MLLVTFESRPSIAISTGPFSEPDFNAFSAIINETTSPFFNFSDGVNSNSTESLAADINFVIVTFEVDEADITVLSSALRAPASTLFGFLSHSAFFKLNLIV